MEDGSAVLARGNRYFRDFEEKVGPIRCFDIRGEGLECCVENAEPGW